MGAVYEVAIARGVRARRPPVPAERVGAAPAIAVPAGCKGPACPAFATCQGGCASLLSLAKEAVADV